MTMTREDRYQHLIVNLMAGECRCFVHGPDRIVINSEGEAVRLHSTVVQPVLGQPDKVTEVARWAIAFIRSDGWTLGAPKEFEHVAYRMWHEDWIAFMRPGDREATAISEYKPTESEREQAKAIPAAKTCPRCGSPCEKRTRGRWDLEWRWACLYCTWTDLDG